MLPNFLFIGPDKAGSSWLHHMFQLHPQCHVPDCKDLYYFDRYYNKGMDWYLKQFGEIPASTRALGELSHDYLFSAQACERIAADLPFAKLICCLRNPAERSFSHFLYLKRNGLTNLSFIEAIARLPEITEKSLYAKHLEPYLARFPNDQILILNFADLKADSSAFARTVFSFLNVDPDPGIDTAQTVRPAGHARNPQLAKMLHHGAWITRRIGFPAIVGAIKHSAFAGWFYPGFVLGNKPRLMPKERALLIKRFSQDIHKLESLLDRDFSSWLDTQDD